MALKEKPRCPRCKKLPNARHCIKGDTCTWFVCRLCTPAPNITLVFDSKGRYYER